MPRGSDTLERRQSRLARRTRLIGWAKWLLPLAALALVAGILLAGRERTELVEVFTPEELARLGSGLRLENPRIAGRSDRGQAYELIADAAVPEGPMADEVELEAPRGWIETGARRLDGLAERAHLDRASRRLELSGGVEVETSDGWTGETERLGIDLDAGHASGPGPVRLSGPRGTLEAGSFRVEQGDGAADGPRIWFENGVHVLFTPPPDGDAPR